ncbi:DUF2793 domain-containing protein [Rhodovulum marinum]|uniref:Uncharacterized protein DUF2793 n=1 Tax=Rhodovulum marinum TaxID=320662 RepID=A0A4R2Q137_9RHOB|nr:DUF2793 domain-containing protein [Rhodovulum marinum]TCP42322.1 uncharacterized protein DUF2793 [Rhodovulum marinum]
MSETANLSLPFLQAAQAQKHVTVNEALVKLDALVQLCLQSVSLAEPPSVAADGQAWGVAPVASAEWAGQDGRIAISDNGGWVFATPQAGWRAWVADAATEMRHDGARWLPVSAGGAVSTGGATFKLDLLEFDHQVLPGIAQPTAIAIPSHAVIFGVTARVISEITGTLSSWRLGTEGAEDRFGSGLGLGLNSYVQGVLGQPMTDYSPTPLVLTAEDGEFAGGAVRFAIHFAVLGLPAEV